MYLKDKLEDDELDLSLMQLSDVPVKDIEKLGNKVLKLNISHNLLTMIPGHLPLLSHLTAIDLSKNQIKELPENFGQLVKLRTLDLYSNEIEKLPVSFAQLKNLKWLDLKENPLVPELAKAAGPCITKIDCEQAAKRVVARLQSIESQLFQEKKKRLEAEERIRRQREKAEEAERERLRAEKKLAKERRREEARLRELESKEQLDGDRNNVQINGMSSPKKGPAKNGSVHNTDSPASTAGFSCFGFLLKLMMLLSVATVATGILLLWIYTDGKMDSESIQLAVPIIQKDVESYLLSVGKKTERMYKQVEKSAKPYVESTVKNLETLWSEAHDRMLKSYAWAEANYGDSVRDGWAKLKIGLQDAGQTIRAWLLEAWKVANHWALLVWDKLQELHKDFMPVMERYWKETSPHLEKVGQQVTELVYKIKLSIQTNVPVYYEWIQGVLSEVYQQTYQYFQQIIT